MAQYTLTITTENGVDVAVVYNGNMSLAQLTTEIAAAKQLSCTRNITVTSDNETSIVLHKWTR